MKGTVSVYHHRNLRYSKYIFILFLTVNCSVFDIKMDIGPVAIGGHVSEGSCIGIRGGTFHGDGKCHNTTVFFGSGTFNDALSSGIL